jgi:hypothetical protein
MRALYADVTGYGFHLFVVVPYYTHTLPHHRLTWFPLAHSLDGNEYVVEIYHMPFYQLHWTSSTHTTPFGLYFEVYAK